MSYLDKEYISPAGTNFTDFINNQEDMEKFEKMCDHEQRCVNVPAKECMEDVIAALKIGADLMGLKIYFADPRMN